MSLRGALISTSSPIDLKVKSLSLPSAGLPQTQLTVYSEFDQLNVTATWNGVNQNITLQYDRIGRILHLSIPFMLFSGGGPAVSTLTFSPNVPAEWLSSTNVRFPILVNLDGLYIVAMVRMAPNGDLTIENENGNGNLPSGTTLTINGLSIVYHLVLAS